MMSQRIEIMGLFLDAVVNEHHQRFLIFVSVKTWGTFHLDSLVDCQCCIDIFGSSA